MRVRVRTDIDPHLMDRKAHKAALVLTIQAMKDTNKFVPFRTGSQSNRARPGEHMATDAKRMTEAAVDEGRPVIIYPGPYARYLYHGKLMVDPVTGSSWASTGVTKTLTDKNLVFSQTTGHDQAQSYWFEASKALNMDKWRRVYGRALNSDH